MISISNIFTQKQPLALKAGLLCCAALATSGAQALELPSGLRVELSEVLVDKVGAEDWVRFRFISPQIGPSADKTFAFNEIEGDFEVVCEQLALPYIDKYGLNADKIVISISDRAVAFGTSDPDATQFFEQFRAENANCIWEAF